MTLGASRNVGLGGVVSRVLTTLDHQVDHRLEIIPHCPDTILPALSAKATYVDQHMLGHAEERAST